MYERYLMLLKENNCKTADVARETKIHPSTFSDWKKGKSSPKYDKIQKIAEYFRVDPDWLTGKSEFKTSAEMLQHFDNSSESSTIATEKANVLELVKKHYGKNAMQILQMFLNMNQAGQKKVLEDISDMIELSKYRKILH